MHWSPHVAVVTMLAADHVDWHGSPAAYLEAKKNIVRFQKPDDFAVLGENVPHADDFARATKAKVVRFSTRSKPFDLLIPGDHNQFNAQAAFAAANLFGVTWGAAQQAIRDFPGLAHRLELVHECQGVRYYNDSIATIPEAAIAALKAFAPAASSRSSAAPTRVYHSTPSPAPFPPTPRPPSASEAPAPPSPPSSTHPPRRSNAATRSTQPCKPPARSPPQATWSSSAPAAPATTSSATSSSAASASPNWPGNTRTDKPSPPPLQYSPPPRHSSPSPPAAPPVPRRYSPPASGSAPPLGRPLLQQMPEEAAGNNIYDILTLY